MALSHELISQFAKVVNSDKKQSTETTIYGTVVDKNGHKPGDVDDNGNKIVIDENGGKYVKPDGSDQLIPITDTEEDPAKANTATNTDYGDRASVLIKNHTATVTGNISSPSASNKDVASKITEFDIAVGQQIQADTAYFGKLTTDKASVGELVAAIVKVAELIVNDANIENLIAKKATVTDLIAKKIDTDVIIADEALIEHLKSSSVDVLSLIADISVIEELIANKVDLNKVEAKNAYLKFANVDFSNIGEATISKLFTDYGVIKELIIEDGTVVKELVGVTIKGDLIEAGTLKADRLVVKGSDGKYYALSTDFTAIPGVTPVEEDAIHGSVLIEKSIVAEKIAVDDLVAFGATIGRFHIDYNEDSEIGAIYSGVKNSVDNTTRGIYMDTDGQFAVGDEDNYIKFGKDPSGNYRLGISVVDKLKIGGRNLLRYTERLPITYDLSTGIDTNGTGEPFSDSDSSIKFVVPEDGSGGITIPLASNDIIQNGELMSLSFDYKGIEPDGNSIYFLEKQVASNLLESFSAYSYGNLNYKINDVYIGSQSIQVASAANGIEITGTSSYNQGDMSWIEYALHITENTSYQPGVKYTLGLFYLEGTPDEYPVSLRLYYSDKNNFGSLYFENGFVWTDAYISYGIALLPTDTTKEYNCKVVPMLIPDESTLPDNMIPVTVHDIKHSIVGEWTHFVCNLSVEHERKYHAILLYNDPTINEYNWVEIKKRSLKLETGTKSTDWTPAPEDSATYEEINSLNTRLSENEAAIKQTVNEISLSVGATKVEIDNAINAVKDDINILRNDASLAITENNIEIKVQEILSNGGVNKIDTGMGYVFDDEGMVINRIDHEGNPISPTNTTITENGMTVNSNNPDDADDPSILEANKDGVNAVNLHAKTYLVVAGSSRFEKINGTNRIGCFWIGE